MKRFWDALTCLALSAVVLLFGSCATVHREGIHATRGTETVPNAALEARAAALAAPYRGKKERPSEAFIVEMNRITKTLVARGYYVGRSFRIAAMPQPDQMHQSVFDFNTERMSPAGSLSVMYEDPSESAPAHYRITIFDREPIVQELETLMQAFDPTMRVEQENP